MTQQEFNNIEDFDEMVEVLEYNLDEELIVKEMYNYFSFDQLKEFFSDTLNSYDCFQ